MDFNGEQKHLKNGSAAILQMVTSLPEGLKEWFIFRKWCGSNFSFHHWARKFSLPDKYFRLSQTNYIRIHFQYFNRCLYVCMGVKWDTIWQFPTYRYIETLGKWDEKLYIQRPISCDQSSGVSRRGYSTWKPRGYFFLFFFFTDNRCTCELLSIFLLGNNTWCSKTAIGT